VADDLLKNDGKKFLDMMERLAERRMQKEDISLDQNSNYFQEEEDDEDGYEDDEDEVSQVSHFKSKSLIISSKGYPY
jgi:hypothetical protein